MTVGACFGIAFFFIYLSFFSVFSPFGQHPRYPQPMIEYGPTHPFPFTGAAGDEEIWAADAAGYEHPFAPFLHQGVSITPPPPI